MTFSISGFCDKTGMVGVAITTSSICVASRCPWVRSGVGAATTQNITDPSLGNLMLDNLEKGLNVQQSIDEVVKNHKYIDYLNKSWNLGYKTFDTAIAYDDAQRIIGLWIKKSKNYPKIYTKVSTFKNNKNLSIKDSFSECLKQLNLTHVEGVFLHNDKDWNSTDVKKFASYLLENSLTKRFGLSIYDTTKIPDDPRIQIIQIPANIFNYQNLRSKKLINFYNKGGIVQIRSIFIQGLLLMDINSIPKFLKMAEEPIKKFYELVYESNCNPISLAMSVVKQLLPNCTLVVGAENIKQLKEITKAQHTMVEENVINEALRLGERYSHGPWDPRKWKTR